MLPKSATITVDVSPGPPVVDRTMVKDVTPTHSELLLWTEN